MNRGYARVEAHGIKLDKTKNEPTKLKLRIKKALENLRYNGESFVTSVSSAHIFEIHEFEHVGCHIESHPVHVLCSVNYL